MKYKEIEQILQRHNENLAHIGWEIKEDRERPGQAKVVVSTFGG